MHIALIKLFPVPQPGGESLISILLTRYSATDTVGSSDSPLWKGNGTALTPFSPFHTVLRFTFYASRVASAKFIIIYYSQNTAKTGL